MTDPIIVDKRAFRPRLPDHLKQTVPHGPALRTVQNSLRHFDLNTVCEAAKCPNRTHCYERGTLAFQILGAICTRACGFCAEKFGVPNPPSETEIDGIIETALSLKLRHVVITAPARDDLKDGGAAHFAATVRALHEKIPSLTVEVLTSDFEANDAALHTVFESKPDIFNHNIETVRRLSPKVRSKATYDRSLFVLKKSAEAGLVTKSGLMVGHGETRPEIWEAFYDLRDAGVSMVTIGQYLPPSPRHLPLVQVYAPAQFDELRQEALQCGFLDVASGPLVRSSYQADVTAEKIRTTWNKIPSTEN